MTTSSILRAARCRARWWRSAFRQAISLAVDREAFAETVFLGAAVPIWGPITAGNRVWFWPDVPRYPYDATRARELLRGIGLEDRNGNGTVEEIRNRVAAALDH